jgi:type II secretory pathway pseudopilin PulG
MDTPPGPASAPAPGIPDDSPRRPCPLCGELIPAAAKLCRFCRAEFDAEGRPKPAPPPAPSSDKTTRTVLTVLGIGCGALLFLFVLVPILAGLLLPVLARAREQARRASCSNNLANIAKCCELYAQANGGQYPERLSQLYPLYVKDVRVFTCPSAQGPKVLSPEEIDAKSSYEYLGVDDPEDKNGPLVQDQLANHRQGRNIAIRGGNSVEWIEGTAPTPAR